MKAYAAPHVSIITGRIEFEPGPGQRLRVRCAKGHYVMTDGTAAPPMTLPAPMSINESTRAIVLHRRLCGVATI